MPTPDRPERPAQLKRYRLALPPALEKQLIHAAVERDVTVQDAIVQAIEEYLARDVWIQQVRGLDSSR